MRGSLLVFVCFFVSSLSANESVEHLEAVKKRFEELLYRIEKGQEPCHLQSCQLEKYQLLERLSHRISRIPSSASPFIDTMKDSIFAGYRLAENPAPYFLETASKEEERIFAYSHHLRWRQDWQLLISDIRLLRNFIEVYETYYESDEEQAKLLRLIDQGLFELAFHLTEGERSSEDIVSSPLADQSEELEELKKKTDFHFEQYYYYRDKIRPELQAQGRRLFDTSSHGEPPLFPDLSSAESLQMILHLRDWAGPSPSSRLFRADQKRFLGKVKEELQDALRWAQEFHDLEFGVVGLSNLDSIANPIQQNQEAAGTYLDVFRREARAETWMSHFDFTMNFLLFNAWMNYKLAAFPTAWSEYRRVSRESLTDANALQISFLRMEAIDLERQMENRRESLVRTRDLLLRRLEQVELELEYLNREVSEQ